MWSSRMLEESPIEVVHLQMPTIEENHPFLFIINEQKWKKIQYNVLYIYLRK